MINGQLVSSPEANEFFGMASLATGRKALMGDRTKFEGSRSAAAMQQAEGALVSAFEKLKNLQNDKTRLTDVDKHVFGKELAEKTIAAFERSKNTLMSDSETYADEAIEMQHKAFTRTSSTEFELKANLEWIQARAKEKDGPAAIREAMQDDRDVAYLIYNMKPHLLGLSKEQRGSLWNHAVKRYAPQSLELLETSRLMADAAHKHEVMIGKIGRSLYHPSVAAQAATRVAI